MKRTSVATCVCLLVWLLTATKVTAQNFTLDWFTIDGGGGTSTGSAYSVSGTIGQPDAGVSSGGNYSLIGGFWGAVIPVQQVGGPTLFIANHQNGSVKVSWIPNTPGFVLQASAALHPTPVAWTNAPAAYTNGAIIPASVQTRYFRLTKP
jgi:hypothetical protein